MSKGSPASSMNGILTKDLARTSGDSYKVNLFKMDGLPVTHLFAVWTLKKGVGV